MHNIEEEVLKMVFLLDSDPQIHTAHRKHSGHGPKKGLWSSRCPVVTFR